MAAPTENFPLNNRAQEEASKYLATHNLERLFTQMINQLLFTKPLNPKIELILFLADRIPQALLAENGIHLQGSHGQTRVADQIESKFKAADSKLVPKLSKVVDVGVLPEAEIEKEVAEVAVEEALVAGNHGGTSANSIRKAVEKEDPDESQKHEPLEPEPVIDDVIKNPCVDVEPVIDAEDVIDAEPDTVEEAVVDEIVAEARTPSAGSQKSGNGSKTSKASEAKDDQGSDNLSPRSSVLSASAEDDAVSDHMSDSEDARDEDSQKDDKGDKT